MTDTLEKIEDSLIAEMGIVGRAYNVRALRSDDEGDGRKILMAMAWKGDEPTNLGIFNEQILHHLEALYNGHLTYEEFGKLVEIDIEMMKKL